MGQPHDAFDAWWSQHYSMANLARGAAEDAWNAATMAERERSLLECEELCRKAAGYYESGAGSSHSPAARHVAKMQAIWLAEEIAAIRRGTP